MNKIQRCLILISSIIILLPSSHSLNSEYLKLFFGATLLFFALIPKTWWNWVSSSQSEAIANEDTSKKIESDETRDNEFEVWMSRKIGGDKQLIQISPQSVAYCMSLYRLRITEILRSYSEICMYYYSDSKEDNWVLKILKQCATREAHQEDEKKADQDAQLAYDKRFSYLFAFYPSDDVIIDMQLFLSVYSGSCHGILRRLKYFKEIQFAETKIDELIKHYSTILDCIGSFTFSFFLKMTDDPETEKVRKKARSSFTQIRDLWAEIENLLISNLLIAIDAKIDVTGYFHELEIFDTLQSYFRECLIWENKTKLESIPSYSAFEKQNAIFKEHFKHPSYYYIFK